jgi:hypothetical protein
MRAYACPFSGMTGSSLLVAGTCLSSRKSDTGFFEALSPKQSAERFFSDERCQEFLASESRSEHSPDAERKTSKRKK